MGTFICRDVQLNIPTNVLGHCMMGDRKRRRISTRLPNWDYASNAWYFVTICTRDRQPFFGDIVNQTMTYSDIGKIAHQYWLEIPDHCPNVNLDIHVIMPDHVHGILAINTPSNPPQSGRDVQLNVPTGDKINTYDLSTAMSGISPKAGSLSVVLRSYKAAVSRWCRSNGYASFAWQSRFYEHIIRTDDALHQIRQYIHNNPTNWNNPQNILNKS